MSSNRWTLTLAGWALFVATTSAENPPQTIPASSTRDESKTRPGLFRIGPLYLTPQLRIGPVGLDTNTLWIPSRQPIDFRAVGGPGLEIVVPMGPARLLIDGGASYTYYVKHKTERRWGGDGRAHLDWNRGKLEATAEESVRRDFLRPSFEVDQRIIQDQWQTTGTLAIARQSRLSTFIGVSTRRLSVPDHQEFAGTDLTRTLSRSEYLATFVPRVRLTSKTSFVLGADYEVDRFKFETARDADSNRMFGGFEVRSPTRLDGRLVGGVRLFRLKGTSSQAGTHTTAPYIDAELEYRFGAKTRLGIRYLRDLGYSAFNVQADTPTLTNETAGVVLNKDLWWRFNLRAFGTYGQLRTAGAITIVRDAGQTVTDVRHDTIREGGLDFGYQFRGGLRIGMAAVYTNRTSTFEDFGIHGLLVGGTITMGGLSYASTWPR